MYSRRGVGRRGSLTDWHMQDEFRSSGVHSQAGCWNLTLDAYTLTTHTPGGPQASWELVACSRQACRSQRDGQHAKLPVQRDKNAARCMTVKGLCYVLRREPPEALRRS